MLPDDDKRMNRGPEVYSPDDLRVEYSRQERLEMTRFPGGRKRGAGRRYSLRIMLLDLLLLCIIGGIIYPFLVNRNRTGTLEGVECSLSARGTEKELLVSVLMKSSKDAEDQLPFDLTLMINDTVVNTLADITPPPGEERYYRFSRTASEGRISVRALIVIGEKEIQLNTATGRDG